MGKPEDENKMEGIRVPFTFASSPSYVSKFLFIILQWNNYAQLCSTEFLLDLKNLTALVPNVVNHLMKYSISHLQEAIFSH